MLLEEVVVVNVGIIAGVTQPNPSEFVEIWQIFEVILLDGMVSLEDLDISGQVLGGPDFTVDVAVTHFVRELKPVNRIALFINPFQMLSHQVVVALKRGRGFDGLLRRRICL